MAKMSRAHCTALQEKGRDPIHLLPQYSARHIYVSKNVCIQNECMNEYRTKGALPLMSTYESELSGYDCSCYLEHLSFLVPPLIPRLKSVNKNYYIFSESGHWGQKLTASSHSWQSALTRLYFSTVFISITLLLQETLPWANDSMFIIPSRPIKSPVKASAAPIFIIFIIPWPLSNPNPTPCLAQDHSSALEDHH